MTARNGSVTDETILQQRDVVVREVGTPCFFEKTLLERRPCPSTQRKFRLCQKNMGSGMSIDLRE